VVIENFSIPTVILNESRLINERRDLAASVPLKRLQSVEYYLENSTAEYYLWINDDSYIMVRNIARFIAYLRATGKTPNAHFMLGNCMGLGEWFLQGAFLFMSRTTAEIFCKYLAEHRHVANRSEDVAIVDVFRAIGIHIKTFPCGFFLGQYLSSEDIPIMEKFRFELLKKCPDPNEFRGKKGCKPFLSRFNRLVGLHRLSGTRFKGPVIPVWNYPDYVYWYMPFGHFPQFCWYNSTEDFIPDYNMEEVKEKMLKAEENLRNHSDTINVTKF
jgi:hypothetical protein